MPRRRSSSESACTRRAAMLAPSARSLSTMSTWRTSGPASVRCFMLNLRTPACSSKSTEYDGVRYARRGRARLHLVATRCIGATHATARARDVYCASEASAQRDSVGARLVEERLPTGIVEEIEQAGDLHDVLVEQIPTPQRDFVGVADASADPDADVVMSVLHQARVGRERRVVAVGPRPIDAAGDATPARRRIVLETEADLPRRSIQRTLA